MMDEEQRRYEKIRGAYRSVGRLANLYDGMMTYSTWSGKFVSRLVWGLDRAGVARYVGLALRAAHEGFAGRLLEVPVGTGCLSLPVYAELPDADITCLDYSPAMLAAARARADALGVRNVAFVEGDVGQLTFEDDFFDAVVSINGFHAFPDKESAWAEVHRVLRPGGRLTGRRLSSRSSISAWDFSRRRMTRRRVLRCVCKSSTARSPWSVWSRWHVFLV